MRFTISVGYAISILVYMTIKEGETVRTRELVEKIPLPEMFSMKITRKLKEARFIQSVQGRYGGYILIKGAEQITIYDVVCAIDGEFSVYSLEGKQSKKGMLGNTLQSTTKYFKEIENMVKCSLKSMTIADYCAKYLDA